MSMNRQTSMLRRRSVRKSNELEDLQVGGGGGDGSEDDAEEGTIRFDTEWLDLSRCVIEEKNTKIMARALESNRVNNLKILFLHKNAGDVGMRAMLNALHLGYLTGLEKIILWEVSSYDQITTAEEGTDTIAESLAEGKMPNLHTLDLTGSLPKLIAPRGWGRVFRDFINCSSGLGRLHKFRDTCLGCLCLKSNSGRNHTLDCLRCQYFKVNVYSGDDGIQKIVRALETHPLTSLKFLNLGENYIGDRGATKVARLLARGALPKLEELDLQNNPVGKRGAEMIVEAFLENPLLTVRVKLDWPTLLLKERASAFRECNIRLEHRLVELKVKMEHDRISQNFDWRIAYYLQRPESPVAGYKMPHRLYMQCQARGHENGPQGEGIQIRRRSCFGTSSRKYVDRELQEEKPREGQPPMDASNSFPSRRSRTTTPSSSSNRGSIHNQVSGPAQRELTPNSTSNREFEGVPNSGPGNPKSLNASNDSLPSERTPTPSSSSKRGYVHFQVSDPAQNSKELPPSSNSNWGSARTGSRPGTGSHLEEEKSLTRHKGVNHIYITAGSCGFIGAAKALGVQTKRGFWRKCYSIVRRALQNQAKTQDHIDSIMAELLMLADRKPHEFYEMFNLRRVILQDPESVFYPAYICSSCFTRLDGSSEFVKPVIHQSLIEREARGQLQISPGSSPSIRKHPKHFPKRSYTRQPSRFS